MLMRECLCRWGVCVCLWRNMNVCAGCMCCGEYVCHVCAMYECMLCVTMCVPHVCVWIYVSCVNVCVPGGSVYECL